MISREQNIQIINGLFPPDETEIGRQLLLDVVADRWRELPDDMLRELCIKNEAEDNRQTKEFLRRKK